MPGKGPMEGSLEVERHPVARADAAALVGQPDAGLVAGGQCACQIRSTRRILHRVDTRALTLHE